MTVSQTLHSCFPSADRQFEAEKSLLGSWLLPTAHMSRLVLMPLYVCLKPHGIAFHQINWIKLCYLLPEQCFIDFYLLRIKYKKWMPLSDFVVHCINKIEVKWPCFGYRLTNISCQYIQSFHPIFFFYKLLTITAKTLLKLGLCFKHVTWNNLQYF